MSARDRLVEVARCSNWHPKDAINLGAVVDAVTNPKRRADLLAVAYPCPTCAGEGVVTLGFGRVAANTNQVQPCPACGGSGVDRVSVLTDLGMTEVREWETFVAGDGNLSVRRTRPPRGPVFAPVPPGTEEGEKA